MSQELMDRFLFRLRAEYPHYPLSVRPYQSPDDESVECFIDILLVPHALLHAVGMRAWELADEVYGNAPVPFLMTSVSPESSAKYFGDTLAQSAGIVVASASFEGAHAPIPLGPASTTTTTAIEAPWGEGAFHWVEERDGAFDSRSTHAWDVVLPIESMQPSLREPNSTDLSTSVRPDEPRYSLAA